MQNRLIHVIEKKKYQGSRGDTKKGRGTQQHSKKVYKFVINYVFRLLLSTSIYPGASKGEDIRNTSIPFPWFSFWVMCELYLEIMQGFRVTQHKAKSKQTFKSGYQYGQRCSLLAARNRK